MRARVSAFLFKFAVASPFALFALVFVDGTSIVEVNSEDIAVCSHFVAVSIGWYLLTRFNFDSSLVCLTFFVFGEDVIVKTFIHFFQKIVEDFVRKDCSVWLHER
jgi:hypothetical protein